MRLFLLLCLVAISTCEEEQKKSRQKPFGYGIGKAYIGGRESDVEGEAIVKDIYSWYVNYKRMLYLLTAGEEQYYRQWYGQNECIGSCPGGSQCSKGICFCEANKGMVQVYGKCVSNGTDAWSAENSDVKKYRKPIPPPIPSWCYRKKKNGGQEIDPKHAGDSRCEEITYPNNFDHNSQFCEAGGTAFCMTKDNNMICDGATYLVPGETVPKKVCSCRKDMKFDTNYMECRIWIDVDCTYARSTSGGGNNSEIAQILRGEKPVPEQATIGEQRGLPFPRENIVSEFCGLLDGVADEYNEHIIDAYEFSLFGLGIGALFAICCGSICAACCCCKCCNSVREKIRRLDPRNATRNLGTGTQMAALGAVAATEYMDNKNERNDEQRIAAMQGGVPGGAPPGYAPVPTGYPAGEPGGYPGYPPVGAPGPGPVYPPGPGYPPAAGQPGYIPPADKGVLGDVVQMAPELALAGGGLATGNMAMAGMGAVAAYEKLEADQDKEDRLRAAAIKGVPPPPMGYAGGQPYGGMPAVSQLPPSTANYPRQNMA